MNIDTQNNITFHGRCPEIKAGNDVCRLIKRNFPSYSVSMLNKRIDKMHECGRLTGEKYEHDVKWLEQRIQIRNYFLHKDLYHSNLKIYFDLMKFIKRTKIADCGHLTDLSVLILRLNGYKASPADIYTNMCGEIDHAVCVFNKSNKPVDAITKETIILDPWLGECDFSKVMLKKYKEKYNGYFKEHGLVGPEEKFIYLKPDERFIALRAPREVRFNDKFISKLRKKFPQFLIKYSKYEQPEPKNKFWRIFDFFKSHKN